MKDAEQIAGARQRTPNLMRRLEALEMPRLVFLEARATSEALRSRSALQAGKTPSIMPAQAIGVAKLIGAVIRERRAAERRAAAVAAQTDASHAEVTPTTTHHAA